MSGYAVVTPACNEAETLPRLASALAAQHVRPEAWVIVVNGSTDATPEVADALATAHPWITVEELPGSEQPERGGAIVRAIEHGVDALARPPAFVVNVDADVTMQPDYFARLLAEFDADPRLGIASGVAYELRGSRWAPQPSTRGSVWGATRAYRWRCLQDVRPLVPRVGWDGLDELKANALGWRTATFAQLPFLHHRLEGERDGARARRWSAQGELAHFMGYRPSYLIARTLFRSLRDPSAVAILEGYARAAATSAPQWEDAAARDYLRSSQRWRHLPARAREALGRVG